METHWPDRRLDELNGRVDELTKRTERGFVEFRTEIQTGFKRIEQVVGQLDAKVEQRFEQVEQHFRKVDDRLLKVEVQLENLGERSRSVERRLDGLIYSIIGVAASAVVATAALIATNTLS